MGRWKKTVFCDVTLSNALKRINSTHPLILTESWNLSLPISPLTEPSAHLNDKHQNKELCTYIFYPISDKIHFPSRFYTISTSFHFIFFLTSILVFWLKWPLLWGELSWSSSEGQVERRNISSGFRVLQAWLVCWMKGFEIGTSRSLFRSSTIADSDI